MSTKCQIESARARCNGDSSTLTQAYFRFNMDDGAYTVASLMMRDTSADSGVHVLTG